MTSTRTIRALSIIAAIAAPGITSADDSGPDARAVGITAAHGGGATGYRTSISVEVPPFHGVEPSVALDYDSARGDGNLGPGWRLAAASYIERVSLHRGSPRFDATDVYLIDGSANGELDLCPAASSSPSCIDGGIGQKFQPRYESFSRARFDGTTNAWTITRGDGTVARYGASTATRMVGPSGTLRWYLETVTNTHGLVATYSYAADSTAQCADMQVAHIAYGAASVDVYYDPRPDPVMTAAGGCVIRTDKRAKTIAVTAAGKLARAYALAYTTTTATSRSVLATVTRWGTAALVGATGAVSGGISEVVGRFSYVADTGPAFGALSAVGAAGIYDGDKILFDFSGDGIADLCEMRNCSPADPVCTADPDQPTGVVIACAIGKGDGSFGPATTSVVSTTAVDGTRPFTSDLDADGRADFCYAGASSTGLVSHCAISKGDGKFGPLVATTLSTSDMTGYVTRLGDITGDGIADLCAVSDFDVRCAVGKGNGSFGPLVASMSSVELGSVGAAVALRDVDGDGAADLCNANPTLFEVTCLRSDGKGGFGASVTTRLAASGSYSPVFGDLDGDGVVDVCGRKAAAGTVVACALGLGDGSFGPLIERTLTAAANANAEMWMGDVTGDRDDDVCLVTPGTSLGVSCAASLGNGALDTLVVKSFTANVSGNAIDVVDIDGDGSADICALPSDKTSGARCVRSTSVRPSYLASQVNVFGGTTSIAYTPSTAWHNGFLPQGFVVQTASSVSIDDGRGNTSSRPTTYAGGVFDLGERRFVGFATATTTVDAAGTRVVTTFAQTRASAGRVRISRIEDATGKAWTTDTTTYAETTAPPYRSLATQVDDSECDLGTTCRTTRVQRSYDAYGNVVLVQDAGDLAVTGDEHTTQILFYPNLPVFITAIPGIVNDYAGLGTAGTLLHRTQSVFDGATAATVPPTKANITQTRVWNSKDGSYITTTRAFDMFGNATTVTNALAHATTTTWDSSHVYPATTCDALAHCQTFVYDARLGAIAKLTDANGQTTTHTYDSLGRETQVAYPNGGFVNTVYVYTAAPTLQYVEVRRPDGSSDGGVWSRAYLDGHGRAYKKMRDGGFIQDIAFAKDVPSRVASTSAPYGTGETAKLDVFGYDGLGRNIQIVHADGSKRITTFAPGRRADTDELGHSHTTVLDSANRPLSIVQPDGSTASYHYDPIGRLAATTDPIGGASTTTYNSLDRATRTCNPDAGCTIFNYDGLERMTTQTDARNQTVAFAYDADDRVIAKSLPGGKAYTWAYDEAGRGKSIGRMTTHAFPAGSDAFVYDAVGHATTETMCRGETCYAMTSTFDTVGAGRLDKLMYPDGEVVDYNYNSSSAVSAIVGYASAITHDARGELRGATLANGTVEAFVFDPVTFRPKQIAVKKSTTVLFEADLGFAANGLVTTEAIANGSGHSFAFGYDALDRLTSVNDAGSPIQTFTYDAAGNITRNSLVGAYTYDATRRHAVTKAGTASYAYDASGNMTSRAGKSLGYDGEGRLVSTADATYDYDGAGTRVDKSDSTGTTRYFGRYLEHDGTSLIKYIYLDGRRLARHVGLVATAGKSFFHIDHLGSVRAITDQAGAVVRRYDYRPFGEVSATTGTLANDVRFTGERSDDDTGLVLLGARYYDPVLGRFVSADSIVPTRRPQDMNRYAYVRNNPLGDRDPSGHEPYSDGDHHVMGGGGGYSSGVGGGGGCSTNCGGGASHGDGPHGGSGPIGPASGPKYRDATPADPGMMTPGSKVQTTMGNGKPVPGSGVDGYGNSGYQVDYSVSEWNGITRIHMHVVPPMRIRGFPWTYDTEIMMHVPVGLTPDERSEMALGFAAVAGFAAGAVTDEIADVAFVGLGVDATTDIVTHYAIDKIFGEQRRETEVANVVRDDNGVFAGRGYVQGLNFPE